MGSSGEGGRNEDPKGQMEMGWDWDRYCDRKGIEYGKVDRGVLQGKKM